VDLKATTCIILVSHPPFGTTPMRAGGYILLTFRKLLFITLYMMLLADKEKLSFYLSRRA